METFLQSGKRGLKARSEDEQAVHERELRELRAKGGELVLELAVTCPPVCGPGIVRAEGQMVSITQSCRWFGVPRSTLYYRPAVGTARPPVIDTTVVKVRVVRSLS